jgi:hypothetical protein
VPPLPQGVAAQNMMGEYPTGRMLPQRNTRHSGLQPSYELVPLPPRPPMSKFPNCGLRMPCEVALSSLQVRTAPANHPASASAASVSLTPAPAVYGLACNHSSVVRAPTWKWGSALARGPPTKAAAGYAMRTSVYAAHDERSACCQRAHYGTGPSCSRSASKCW